MSTASPRPVSDESPAVDEDARSAPRGEAPPAAEGVAGTEKLKTNASRGSLYPRRLRVGHNPDQGTTEALSHPFVVFVNDGTNPRYRLTQEQAYELLTSLQQALGILKTR